MSVSPLRAALNKELDFFARLLEIKLKEEILRVDAFDTGNLYNSVVVNPSDKGLRITIADYYIDVDKGSKPGRWVDENKIREWVKRRINPPALRVNSVTFLVRRKIYNKGIDARPFFDIAISEWKRIAIQDIEERLSKSRLFKKRILTELGF